MERGCSLNPHVKFVTSVFNSIISAKYMNCMLMVV